MAPHRKTERTMPPLGPDPQSNVHATNHVSGYPLMLDMWMPMAASLYMWPQEVGGGGVGQWSQRLATTALPIAARLVGCRTGLLDRPPVVTCHLLPERPGAQRRRDECTGCSDGYGRFRQRIVLRYNRLSSGSQEVAVFTHMLDMWVRRIRPAPRLREPMSG